MTLPLAALLQGGVAGQPTGQLYVDDVFSTYLYTGNGSTQTITNGIDLSTYGGLVWIKNRTDLMAYYLIDTIRGAGYSLQTQDATGQNYNINILSSFTSTGFGVGTGLSEASKQYVSWTFRKAPKFFHVTTATVSGSDVTVDLSVLGTVGMVAVKRTDSTGSWFVWHRSLTAGKLLYFSNATSGVGTAAETTDDAISVSGTTLTLKYHASGDGPVNGTYVVYAWAHDTSADGIIQAGSFTTDGGGSATVNLGWEPQYLLIKRTTGSDSWYVADTMRGWSMSQFDAILRPDLSAAEASFSQGAPTATGFFVEQVASSAPYIYLAIRRPNKPPTSGTQVYNAIARTGTGAAATVTSVGFAIDLFVTERRSATGTGARWEDRLRGSTQELDSGSTGTESTVAQSVTSFASMDGVTIGTDGDWNTNAATYINWFFRRAPGVFDVVCYTGTGSNKTETHNLTVAPELVIVKNRSDATGRAWAVWASGISNTEYLVLNTTAAKATDTTYWNSTSPTSTTISLGTANSTNESADTFVAYLFATKPGISKVGGYTGNGGTADSAGTSQTINCGFSAGARFVLIKCTSHAGDWLVWDSTRGIVSGNDPHLSLNTTTAEVTTDDAIDPDNSGFIVNQLAVSGGLPTSGNLNVTGRTYIFLAYA